jgi:hypothetical protein
MKTPVLLTIFFLAFSTYSSSYAEEPTCVFTRETCINQFYPSLYEISLYEQSLINYLEAYQNFLKPALVHRLPHVKAEIHHIMDKMDAIPLPACLSSKAQTRKKIHNRISKRIDQNLPFGNYLEGDLIEYTGLITEEGQISDTCTQIIKESR